MDTFLVALILIIVPCTIIKICQIHNNWEETNRYKLNQMTKEERKKYEQKEREKIQKKGMRQANALERKKAHTVRKAIIISGSSDSRKKMGSSVIRGAVGGTLLGPVGMVGGALSGKNKITNTTTFLVEYEDGHKETKTVDNNSSEFKKLCQYVEM